MNPYNNKNAYIFPIEEIARTPLLLDLYPGAGYAYSLRQLRIGANKCFTVRRNGVSPASMDIGFINIGGNVWYFDYIGCSAFVGGNDGFITKWFDQSLIGLDLNQNINADNPQIIQAGSYIIDTLTTKRAMNFLVAGTGMQLITANTTNWTSALGEWQFYGVHHPENWTGSHWCFDADLFTAGNRVATFNAAFGGPIASAWNNANIITTVTHNVNPPIGNTILASSMRTVNDIQLWINNNSIGAVATPGTPKISPSILGRCGRFSASSALGHRGLMLELIGYPDAVNRRVAIQNDINSFYNIYP